MWVAKASKLSCQILTLTLLHRMMEFSKLKVALDSNFLIQLNLIKVSFFKLCPLITWFIHISVLLSNNGNGKRLGSFCQITDPGNNVAE